MGFIFFRVVIFITIQLGFSMS